VRVGGCDEMKQLRIGKEAFAPGDNGAVPIAQQTQDLIEIEDRQLEKITGGLGGARAERAASVEARLNQLLVGIVRSRNKPQAVSAKSRAQAIVGDHQRAHPGREPLVHARLKRHIEPDAHVGLVVDDLEAGEPCRVDGESKLRRLDRSLKSIRKFRLPL